MLKTLKNNHDYLKYFKNTSWMLADKFITMAIILIMNILISRYLGPENFGFLSYSVALVTVFAVATHMGLGGIVIKELVSFPDEQEKIIGTVFFLKLLGALFGFLVVLIIDIFTEEVLSLNFFVLFIIALSIFFKPFEVIDFWFIANVKAKYTAITNTVSLLIVSMLRLIFIFGSMSLLWFATANLIQAFIIATLFIYFFYNKTNLKFRKLCFSLKKARYLLSKSWMIALGGLFSIIYLKIDMIMLKWLVGSESVGVYAVAASLSEVWYILPTIIVTSLFPKIIKLKEGSEIIYHNRLQQLFDFLFIMALILAVTISFIAKDLILLLYGKEYAESGYILAIHIWAGVFIFMRALFSKWIIIEDVPMFSLITQGFGALTNVVLNFILIPQYGVYGAAFATLLSYAMASYFVLIFYAKTREIFWMMTKAMVSPFRYLILRVKGKTDG